MTHIAHITQLCKISPALTADPCMPSLSHRGLSLSLSRLNQAYNYNTHVLGVPGCSGSQGLSQLGDAGLGGILAALLLRVMDDGAAHRGPGIGEIRLSLRVSKHAQLDEEFAWILTRSTDLLEKQLSTPAKSGSASKP